jgi:hypothetical protein
MKKKSIIWIAALALCLMASSAWANAVNVRPYNPGAGNLAELQSVFTGIGSTINAYTDQTGAAIYEPTGAGTSSSSFIAQVTWGYNATTSIGLYAYGDPTKDVILFGPGSTLGARVAISFNYDGLGGVRTVDLGSVSTIDTQANFGTRFGYFIENTALGERWYSEDSLNDITGGMQDLAQALIYYGKGENVTLPSGVYNDFDHYYVAFEGRPNDGRYPFGPSSIDFNDFVIQMESVRPVPEPMTLILLGSGLLGLAAIRRKK